jgi:hypothetical protein
MLGCGPYANGHSPFEIFFFSSFELPLSFLFLGNSVE